MREVKAHGLMASGGNASAVMAFLDTVTQLWSIQMIKYVLPLVMLIGATAPAFAAEYYIIRGPDKKCKIVETRPTDKTITVIGDKAYVTRDEATKQMAVVCK